MPVKKIKGTAGQHHNDSDGVAWWEQAFREGQEVLEGWAGDGKRWELGSGGGGSISYIRYTTDGTSNMLDIRTTDGISDIPLLHIRYTTEMTSHQSEIPRSLIL